MPRISSLLFLIPLGVSVSVSPLQAQSHPDFSGRWVLDLAQSDFGSLPAPTAGADEIDHVGDMLSIDRIRNIGQGPVPSRILYGIDGKEYLNEAAGQTTRSVLKWDGPILEIRSKTMADVYEVSVTDRWKLSSSGLVLTIHRFIEIPGVMQATQTQVLNKR